MIIDWPEAQMEGDTMAKRRAKPRSNRGLKKSSNKSAEKAKRVVKKANGPLEVGDRVRLLVDVLPGLRGEKGAVTAVFGTDDVSVRLDSKFGGVLIGPAPQHKFERT
jgi:hypothetical protein